MLSSHTAQKQKDDLAKSQVVNTDKYLLKHYQGPEITNWLYIDVAVQVDPVAEVDSTMHQNVQTINTPTHSAATTEPLAVRVPDHSQEHGRLQLHLQLRRLRTHFRLLL